MEIEKEMKKVTLGHEFGAGAACLKCKEKCEGFELHFWRKICRNCKCGLAEHDVSMNSEENKKVGKLFEDTKYTGLIAKLKTDGIPRYQGNMVTITLPSPATAYTMPPLASSTIVPPSPTVAYAQPAVTSPGPVLIGSPAQAQGRPLVLSTDVTVTPVKANKVPVTASATAANVVPVPKDVPMKSITYEWAPPVANKHLAVRYIELLPPEKRPVAGTQGAAYRRQQMDRQLPEHDQDPSKCHELSPAEVKQMQQYVRKCKDEALGIGDVLLPEEVAQIQAGGTDAAAAGSGVLAGSGVGGFGPAGLGAGAGSGSGYTPGSGTDQSAGLGPARGSLGTAATAGAINAGLPQKNFSCHHCKKPMLLGEPAVYAERAGYDKLWHPACFVCCTCSELLVDMIYFWKKGKMYCGRHYGDSEKPRCGGCDELIFSNEYTQAEGQNWHLKHFCCFDCDCILAGETYVMENDKPICKPCYMKNYAVIWMLAVDHLCRAGPDRPAALFCVALKADRCPAGFQPHSSSCSWAFYLICRPFGSKMQPHISLQSYKQFCFLFAQDFNQHNVTCMTVFKGLNLFKADELWYL
uniref:Testin n=1 Tax=Xiphophorus maculatus TaxID=8083 RepID=A0A3B5PV06_XIPMA